MHVVEVPVLFDLMKTDRRALVHHFSLNGGHSCFDEVKGPPWVYCDSYKRGQAEEEPLRLSIDICPHVASTTTNLFFSIY